LDNPSFSDLTQAEIDDEIVSDIYQSSNLS
jgi:hypothetical protein